MRLGAKQELFAELMTQQLLWLLLNGYRVRFGDFFRDPRSHGKMNEEAPYGRRSSVHKLKLAGDLNLFKDGKWLQTTEGHRESGEHWESLHSLCRWGGRFKDGNHYSLKHGRFA